MRCKESGIPSRGGFVPLFNRNDYFYQKGMGEMQNATEWKSKRTALLTKDYILIGVFTVLIYIVNAIVGMALTPLIGLTAMPLIAGICLFFSSVVYLIMAMKVGKRGVLFLFAMVTGLFYTLMGVPFMLAFMAVAGLLGELSLLGGGQAVYRSFLRQSIAFSIYGTVYGFGSFAMVYIYGSAALKDMFAPKTLEVMTYFSQSASWMLGSLVFTFVLTWLGCLFGRSLLRKHFVKSGMIR